MKADRNPAHLFPAFAEKVERIVIELDRWCEKHWPGHGAMLAEGYRSEARQRELYAQGRTAPGEIVTEKNGTTNKSKHQSTLAADIVGKTAKGDPTWECPPGFWSYLQHLAHVEGLISGRDWRGFVDLPHVEWPGQDVKTFAAAKAWKKTAGLS